VNPRIAGEDVATVLMTMGADDAAVTVEMSYASPTEREAFPQTTLFVEADHGSLEITPGYERHVTDVYGTTVTNHAPPVYPWAEAQYALVQSSMVRCQSDLLTHLRAESTAETTGADNARTIALVDAAYRSAESGRVVLVDGTSPPHLRWKKGTIPL
ncbi:MAG: gfo/Idh/MocA family oxidoreductase, partial [Armatimonadetes bacterium]|nr:gfo/Idh/MocA family oxidoreductase [Armatimonadota bacterium]